MWHKIVHARLARVLVSNAMRSELSRRISWGQFEVLFWAKFLGTFFSFFPFLHSLGKAMLEHVFLGNEPNQCVFAPLQFLVGIWCLRLVIHASDKIHGLHHGLIRQL